MLIWLDFVSKNALSHALGLIFVGQITVNIENTFP